jgi:hypothetical protein
MDTKKNAKKIDFLKITKEEQEKMLKDALTNGQSEQKKLEKRYHKTLMEGVFASVLFTLFK